MSVTHFILYYTHFNKKQLLFFVHTLYNLPLKPLSHIRILSLKGRINHLPASATHISVYSNQKDLSDTKFRLPSVKLILQKK